MVKEALACEDTLFGRDYELKGVWGKASFSTPVARLAGRQPYLHKQRQDPINPQDVTRKLDLYPKSEQKQNIIWTPLGSGTGRAGGRFVLSASPPHARTLPFDCVI